MQLDRHLSISAGWIAGPAAGIAAMAAPSYLEIGPQSSSITFWSGVAVFFCSVVLAMAQALKEQSPQKKMLYPAIFAVTGVICFCIAGALYLRPVPANSKTSADKNAPVGDVSEPKVLLVGEKDRITLYNKGDDQFEIVGTKFGDELPDTDGSDDRPRVVPRDAFYFIYTDRLEGWAKTHVGPNGKVLVNYEMYLTQKAVKYTAKFSLLVTMTNGIFRVDAQNHGVLKDI